MITTFIPFGKVARVTLESSARNPGAAAASKVAANKKNKRRTRIRTIPPGTPSLGMVMEPGAGPLKVQIAGVFRRRFECFEKGMKG
jgi:hypothetical protein